MTSPISPQRLVVETLQGFMAGKALTTAAELGIADQLADGPKRAAEVAAALGVHEDALYRLLRALATRGFFREDAEGRFANTPASELLRTGVPGSMRDYLVYVLHEGNVLAWSRLAEVVRTGEPSFAAANGEDVFPFMAKRPELAERFDRAMTNMSNTVLAEVVAGYDFSRFGTLVDVGGGRGHVLAAVLRATPALRGVLFDQEHVLPRARALLEETGVLERTELVGGDFFRAVPPGHDAYLLKHILHDWDDERARTVLGHVRAAIPMDGTLLVLDAVITPGNDPHPSKWLDLQMMVVLGGRERTRSEHEALLASAGFRLERVLPIPGPVAILEAKPV